MTLEVLVRSRSERTKVRVALSTPRGPLNWAVYLPCVTVIRWPLTIRTAVRSCPELGVAVSLNAPEPEPLAGVIVSHWVDSTTLQSQSAAALTEIQLFSAFAPFPLMRTVVGLRLTLQASEGAGDGDGDGDGDGVGVGDGAVPAWFTDTVFPAIVRFVWRAVVEAFAETMYRTLPTPVPEELFDPKVTQFAGLEALQAHPAAVVTTIVPEAPLAAGARVVGETV